MKHSHHKKTKIKAPTHKRRTHNEAVFHRMAHKGARPKGKLLRGEFRASRDGYGFVTVEGYRRDIFVPEDKTLGAFTGDLVEILASFRTLPDGTEKSEGRVTKIVEKRERTLVGVIECEEEYGIRGRRYLRYRLSPDDRRVREHITLTALGTASVGDKVLAYIVSSERGRHTAEILQSFGRATDREANYEAILKDEGIEIDFSPEALALAEAAASEPISMDGRRDLTRGVIFTIDGEGAKDLDDAISLSPKSADGWHLCVHIADVSHYVKEKSALERTAIRRGTSVYFVDKVVPMLPAALSNGACSLNADTKKYTLTAEMTISDAGELLKTEIYPTVIKSCVRGVYSEVNDLFKNGKDSAHYEKYRRAYPTLQRMLKLYRVLKKRAHERGMLELESSEAQILLDERGMPREIVKRTRGEAEELIEQFMLMANRGVATLLHEKGIPCVYRVHTKPSVERMQGFLEYLKTLDIETTGATAEEMSPLVLKKILERANERGLLAPVSYTLLRSLSKAEYTAVPSGHFGLSLPLYCHFTSPIRRLSDLATHRIIHRVLLEGAPAERYASFSKRAAAAATETELSALSAERRIENLYKTIYMSEHIGEIYPATVSSVMDFGMFVMLENTCEGLIPIHELCGVFLYDEKTGALRMGTHAYRVGDGVTVRLEEADVSTGKLRFSLVTEESAKNR